jgi:hypothetical protein
MSARHAGAREPPGDRFPHLAEQRPGGGRLKEQVDDSPPGPSTCATSGPGESEAGR